MEANKYNKYLQYVSGVRFWIITIGVIILLTALKQSAHYVNIILVAAFLTAISLSPLNWLKKKGLPKWLATTTVIISIVVVVGLIGLLLAESVNNFMDKLPTLQVQFDAFTSKVNRHLINIGIIGKHENILNNITGKSLLPMVAPVASGFGSLISGSVLIFIIFIFMIAEADMFSKKFAFISAKSSQHSEQLINQIKNYFGIKTLTSLSTGIMVGVSLYILGVQFALLWGFLAFILNFIPSIGSFIAAIPAVILALVVNGTMIALIAMIIYLVINTIVGNIIEPQLMGRNLGLSPLVVFLSMILFGYILGPVGMLIATPLAIIIKLIFNSRGVTKNFGILIGDGREIEENT